MALMTYFLKGSKWQAWQFSMSLCYAFTSENCISGIGDAVATLTVKPVEPSAFFQPPADD
jgi:hypothetical protein